MLRCTRFLVNTDIYYHIQLLQLTGDFYGVMYGNASTLYDFIY